MIYLIQNNTFQERHFDMLIQNLERLGLEYEICKYIPFLHEVEFKTERKDVWCFGAYSMMETNKKYDWYPGCMINKNHDFEVYGKEYGDYMLNSDAQIMEFTDPIPDGDQWNEFFARPTMDAKIFSGTIFSRDNWNKYVAEASANDAVEHITSVTKIMISSLKNIQQEIRCWVVAGKVVTISQYKLGCVVSYKNLDHDQEAWDFAQKMVDMYQPARAFVIDICRTSEGFKIVEINCINGCGFYDMNSQKLLMALEEEFNT